MRFMTASAPSTPALVMSPPMVAKRSDYYEEREKNQQMSKND
jgi:hypothetical protein